jgi:1-deoxy-D-xylulose-5-phosphate synthase
MAPKDENELRQMLRTAIAHNGPVAFRYPRGTATGVKIDQNITPLPIGQSETLTSGDDILILAIGHSVSDALVAHELLEEQNIASTVVNCRFAKPLDAERIGSLASKIHRIITVEENVRYGGFGSAVLECLNDLGIHDFNLKRLGIPDTFVEHGPPPLLRTKYGIDSQAIVSAAKKLMHQKTSLPNKHPAASHHNP